MNLEEKTKGKSIKEIDKIEIPCVGVKGAIGDPGPSAQWIKGFEAGQIFIYKDRKE